ncbi:hypothetical protein BDV25DRAFT_151283 [Aspergillus avenaceus]|uniref:Uncharacterized protein n=1 Tax=Aspergillus avenaceus TaxID=36643 RepID=A0A5N6U122_ASPAV|nr:hypothetical protein BDV25DRAFT_151283 [Aspergillus avenaceus]
MRYTRDKYRSWKEVEKDTGVPWATITNGLHSGKIEAYKSVSAFNEDWRILKQLRTQSTLEKLAETAEPTIVSIKELRMRSDKDPPKPTPTSNSLIPYWSYEKSALAAACIFSAFALAGFIFIIVLAARKIRRSWKRHKREKNDYSEFRHRIELNYDEGDSSLGFVPECKSNRESLMYSHGDSQALGYVVEQEGDSVTRVYRESNMVSSQTFDSIGAPLKKGNSARKSKQISDLRTDARTPSGKGRAGSIPRPIVVVPSPLKHVSSLKATPGSPPTDTNSPGSANSSVSAASQGETKTHRADPTKRFSLLRLPSIKLSKSPMFTL